MPPSWTRVLYDLVDGLRAVAVALAAYLPDTRRSGSSTRSASPGRSTGRRSRTDALAGGARASSPQRRSSRGSTSRRPPRDGHPRAPRRLRRTAAELLEQSPLGRGDPRRDDRHRHRLVPASARDRGRRAGRRRRARDRPAPRGDAGGGERVEELRELLAHPRAVAVGETGLDGHHGAETLREQRVLFDAQLALADELDATGRHPQPGGERRDGGRHSSRSPERSSCTASRSPTCSSTRSSGATTSRSPGTSRTRRPLELRESAAVVP